MSARAIRRASQRSRRRCARRAMLAATAAAGAIAPAADAANFPVTNLGNAGAGSLRQAVLNANAAGGPDTITFTGAGASGEISLLSEIAITDDLTITGPGAGALAVSGDSDNDNVRDFATTVLAGDTRIFDVSDPSSPGSPLQRVSISGLTLREGVADNYVGGSGYDEESGGAIYSLDTSLVLSQMRFTDNVATEVGGAVSLGKYTGGDGRLEISDSTFTGNSARESGGAIFSSGQKYDPGEGDLGSSIVNTQITGNRAGGTFGPFGDSYGPDGGGISAKYGSLRIDGSTIAGNTAATSDSGAGGGAYLAGDAVMTNSVVTGNTSGGTGGGLRLAGAKIERTTVTGNVATDAGGGVLGGNKYFGGGPARVDNSTISGNSAVGDGSPYSGRGGGISTYSYTDAPAVVARNSTIASNTASNTGGGVQALFGQPLGDPIVALKGSIVADNTAAGVASDLASYAPPDLPNPGNAFAAGFSLIETPGAVVPEGDPAGTNLTGVDPLLGGLADNGGPGQTHALASTSPAIDAAQANGFPTDQRGQPRTVDAAATNAPLSDGTDMGAFELGDPAASGDDPDTAFAKKPKKKLKLKQGKKTKKLKVKFTGTDNAPPPGPLTFECKVDKGAFDECKSPLKLKLGKGKHTIAVRAIDEGGQVDATPAEAKVKVKKAKPKK